MLATLLPEAVRAADAPPPPAEATKLLPDSLGKFKAAAPARPLEEQSSAVFGGADMVSAATRQYRSLTDELISVALVVTSSNSSAFALLTQSGCFPEGGSGNANLRAALGTKSCAYPAMVRFARGPVFVEVEFKKGDRVAPEALLALAGALAPTLNNDDDEVPVLVKHLPGWPNSPQRIVYAVEPGILKTYFPDQSVLDVVSFEGRAEAVIANYDTQKLVIIEFNTASLATDNNGRLTAKLAELHTQIQPIPSAYRRVGNYSVFVFDAPSEQAANQLIDQVKYQQVVQWLGENPFAYEKATREFTETTLGVFVSVVKASGLALVTCLAVGGFFGAVLFNFRRSQQRAREAYSDSDAMLRLNLDELTPESDPARLLGPPA